MHPLTETKLQLKELSKQIRILKPTRKMKNRNGRELWDIELDLNKARYEFRHLHIAYCLARGRAYEQIEQPKDNNMPNERYFNQLYEALKVRVDAANAEWLARRNATIQVPVEELSMAG
jgi:hypothetical protein